MVVVLHGAVGGWDEVAIAIAAFVVLWVAVKLAGRKPASDDDDEDNLTSEPAPEPEQPSPPERSPTKLR